MKFRIIITYLKLITIFISSIRNFTKETRVNAGGIDENSDKISEGNRKIGKNEQRTEKANSSERKRCQCQKENQGLNIFHILIAWCLKYNDYIALEIPNRHVFRSFGRAVWL